jgi:REP element-mobilizing transposase RayT
MTKSINQVVVHLVFSTKNKKPYILPNVHEQLHRFIAGLCNSVDCQVIQTGGYYDHVHIMCVLSKRITIMKLAEIVKSRSSRWIKNKAIYLEDFQWQTGYYINAVSEHRIPIIKNYIATQNVHHEKKTFSNSDSIFIAKNINVPVNPWIEQELLAAIKLISGEFKRQKGVDPDE